MLEADSSSIETMLRSTSMRYGHIQLFRDDQGWQASVYHYEPKRLTHDGRVMSDPVDALRAALIEDERRTRDLERRYAATVVAQKQAAVAAVMIVAPEGVQSTDEFEDIFS